MVFMKAILFDLDGTLLYTLEDIARSLNHGLQSYGFSELSLAEVEQKVGHGLLSLVKAVIPADSPIEIVQNILKALKSHYRENPIRLSKPYPGIVPLLNKLYNRGLHLGVLSNKDDDLVQIICQSCFPRTLSPCLGLQSSRPPKPDPAGIKHILRLWQLTPADILFVGDSEVDVESARRAGVSFAAVSWGYRQAEALQRAGAHIFLHSPDQLLQYILDRSE